MNTSTAVLEAAASPITVADLASKVGKSADTVRKAVNALVESGELTEAGTAGRAKLFVAKDSDASPRSERIEALDNAILDFVASSELPVSKYDVAEALGAPVSKVYIGLHRAGVQGRYDRHVEVVNDGTRTRKYRIAA